MKETQFEKYLREVTYVRAGEPKHYTDQAITSRVRRLKKLEWEFGIDLDEFLINETEARRLLRIIRDSCIEDRRHTPYSNAVRLYFEFLSGCRIGRIF